MMFVEARPATPALCRLLEKRLEERRIEEASMVLTLGCERKKPRTSELLSGKGRRLQAVQVGTQGKAPSVSLPGNCTLGTGKQRSGEA